MRNSRVDNFRLGFHNIGMWTCESLGDRCLLWRCNLEALEEASTYVLAVYTAWKKTARHGVLDVVPAYREIAVHYDPFRISPEVLTQTLNAELDTLLYEKASPQTPGKVHTLPVVYQGSDMDRVSACTGLPVSEVISRHQHGDYQVAMIGFLPHFPYCLGLPSSLITPRLPTPRKRVPAGSVAIAGHQAGVYPCESPGGWNLLGTTHPQLLEEIAPGDRIRFKAVEVLG